jgi:predicted metal-dependent phosphotriesterase family hydrolase
MSVNPPDQSSIPAPVYDQKNTAVPTISHEHVGEDKKLGVQHIEDKNGVDDQRTVVGGHNNVGVAVIRQKHTIPTTGKRQPTSKWEYVFFCIFCQYSPASCKRD